MQDNFPTHLLNLELDMPFIVPQWGSQGLTAAKWEVNVDFDSHKCKEVVKKYVKKTNKIKR